MVLGDGGIAASAEMLDDVVGLNAGKSYFLPALEMIRRFLKEWKGSGVGYFESFLNTMAQPVSPSCSWFRPELCRRVRLDTMKPLPKAY
jgi:hypothetical protein